MDHTAAIVEIRRLRLKLDDALLDLSRKIAATQRVVEKLASQLEKDAETDYGTETDRLVRLIEEAREEDAR